MRNRSVKSKVNRPRKPTLGIIMTEEFETKDQTVWMRRSAKIVATTAAALLAYPQNESMNTGIHSMRKVRGKALNYRRTDNGIVAMFRKLGIARNLLSKFMRSTYLILV
jgi:hypothetical protein